MALEQLSGDDRSGAGSEMVAVDGLAGQLGSDRAEAGGSYRRFVLDGEGKGIWGGLRSSQEPPRVLRTSAAWGGPYRASLVRPIPGTYPFGAALGACKFPPGELVGSSLNRRTHDRCGILNGQFEPLEGGQVRFLHVQALTPRDFATIAEQVRRRGPIDHRDDGALLAAPPRVCANALACMGRRS